MMRDIHLKVTRILISLSLGLALLFAFGGCGGSSDSSGSAETPESGDASEYSSDVIAPGTVIRFETKDLEGNPVSSEELFADNKVTMLNVWGTFCGPCIGEMPELETIRQEYAGKGAAVVGLVCDVMEEDDSCLQDAFDIIDETGVKYPSLYWNDTMQAQMNVSAIPTTIFVDSEGKVLGKAIIGADPGAYRTALDQYLSGEE